MQNTCICYFPYQVERPEENVERVQLRLCQVLSVNFQLDGMRKQLQNDVNQLPAVQQTFD